MFESDKEDYYKLIRLGNAFSSNYIEYESNEDKYKTFEYEGNKDKDKTLLTREYLDEIKPYLSDLKDNRKTQSDWKIQLTIAISFISSKDSDETRTIHTKSGNIEIMIGNKTDQIIEELFESLLQRYQEGLDKKLKGRKFVFDSVDLCITNFIK